MKFYAYLPFYCLFLSFGGQASALIEIEHLAQPEREWQRSLGHSSPVHGNALVLSPDEAVLYATTSNGFLFAIDPTVGGLLEEIPPEINDRGWEVTCQSGISFAGTNSEYLVYAVIDQPPKGDYTNPKESRVIAVNHEKRSIRWISDPLTGEIAGTPVISSDGRYVFFTRNIEDPSAPSPTVSPTTASPTQAPTKVTEDPATLSPTTEAPINDTDRRFLQAEENGTVAMFTILSDQEEGGIFFEVPSTDLVMTNHKYGPVSIARNVTRGMYEGGQDNTNDIVVWHSRENAASNNHGELQLFQFPATVDANGNNTNRTNEPAAIDPSSLETVQLGTVAWTTNAAPTLSFHGQEVFLGASNGMIQGWVNGHTFDLLPNFQVPLSGGNVTAPPNAAILSADEELLFVSSKDGTFYAVNISAKKVQWKVDAVDDSPILTRAVVSPDDQVVYFPMGSKLYAKSVDSGEDVWTISLDNNDGSLIQADFCISAEGFRLYYVGFEDNIVTSMIVATTKTPSVPPNATNAPPTDMDDTNDTDNKDNTVAIAATIGSIAGIVLIASAVHLIQKYRTTNSDDDGVDMDYDFEKAPPSSSDLRPEGPRKKPHRYTEDPTRI